MIALLPNAPEKKESVHYKAARTRLRRLLRQHNEYDWLDQYELDNVRISLAWLVTQESEETVQMLLTYIHELAPFLQKKGLQQELLRWSSAAVELCHIVQQNPGPLLLLRGEAQYALGLWSESEQSIQAAMQISERQDLHTYAKAVLAIGCLQFSRGNYSAALVVLAQAEKLLDPDHDFAQIARIRAEIAAYYLNRREYDQALALYLQLDQLHRERNGGESSEHMLMMLGVVYRRKKEYQQAATYLHLLLTRARQLKSLSSIASASHHLAWVYLCLHDTTRARRYCGEALALYRDISDSRGMADTYEQAGRISLSEGNIKDALVDLQQSLVMREDLGNQHGAASSLRHLALAYLASGRFIIALRTMCQSLRLYNQLGMLNRSRWLAISLQIFYGLIGKQWIE